MNFWALIVGGLGPDVWEKEFSSTAADFADAVGLAQARAEELGGHVVSLECSTEPVRVLENPLQAATLLAESLAIADKLRADVKKLIEQECFETAANVLDEMGAHFDGTSIALATECGAWHTKDGWEKASTHPFIPKEL